MTTVASYTDIQIDQEVPFLRREVEAATLVRYAGASEDYAHQHWDHLYMTERGFPGVIVHGWLTFAYMCQAVTNWIPREIADIGSFAVRYHRPVYPGPVLCSGRVVRKRQEARAGKLTWSSGRRTQMAA
jgi:acyl dehydratase